MKSLFVSLMILIAGAISVDAWLRLSYEDEVIVRRAELIAVGRLKENSIQYVPYTSNPAMGKSWEYHATLVISEVIKGKSEKNEIPLIIHYGLDPIVGGYVNRDGFMMDVRGNRKDHPTNSVQIFDTGNSLMSGRPVVEDASKDIIWFLRRGTGVYGREPGTNDLGVMDPQDMQPLKLKGYFEAYLSDDPETTVTTYAKAHPDVTMRAQKYFDHLEVQRILRIPEPGKRFDALLPHFLKRESWNSGLTRGDEARQGIVACGKAGGERLLSVFQDPKHKDFRQDIILIWRDMNYTNAAPLLIELLEQDDRFWAEQKLTDGWWDSDTLSALTTKRRDIYGEVYYSVAALRTFHNAEARSAIELTKRRWENIKFDNPQILEECEAALKEFAKQ